MHVYGMHVYAHILISHYSTKENTVKRLRDGHILVPESRSCSVPGQKTPGRAHTCPGIPVCNVFPCLPVPESRFCSTLAGTAQMVAGKEK